MGARTADAVLGREISLGIQSFRVSGFQNQRFRLSLHIGSIVLLESIQPAAVLSFPCADQSEQPSLNHSDPTNQFRVFGVRNQFAVSEALDAMFGFTRRTVSKMSVANEFLVSMRDVLAARSFSKVGSDRLHVVVELRAEPPAQPWR